jgi:hypothetical protein
MKMKKEEERRRKKKKKKRERGTAILESGTGRGSKKTKPFKLQWVGEVTSGHLDSPRCLLRLFFSPSIAFLSFLFVIGRPLCQRARGR